MSASTISINTKVAIVHYWFVGFTGGEKVVEVLAEMFPQADLFALVVKPECLPDTLRSRKLSTSFLQRLPGSRRWHQYFLPLQPFALEQLDLSGYDLVISLESGPAKGVLTHSETCHVCYCLSPMRYLWDLYPSYRSSLGRLVRIVFSLTAHYLRLWDLASASRVDYFGAISHAIASRVRKHYRRDSSVIYPPVKVTDGYLADKRGDYYLVVSRLVDYKRVDLAIQACNQLKRPLQIVGKGDQYRQLSKLAGPTIKFLGHLNQEDLHECYAHCRALLFPGEEDFGLVPVEVQAFGRPVIAYGRGGALETVIGYATEDEGGPEAATGIFFPAQTPESLADTILRFESLEGRFSPEFIRSSVQRFDIPRFRAEMRDFIEQCMADHRAAHETSSANNTLSRQTVDR